MSEKVLAMILAGGKGTRLQSLTRKTAKPAVNFAGKYRIIDFPLSNCANSGINVVGVLTQYESTDLSNYLGNGEKWGLNGVRSQLAVLSPRQTEEGSKWYEGTADAITRNIDFIDSVDPDYILILSGDHIYKTTYDAMIETHIESKADATISVIEVPWEEASRFGILNVNKNDFVTEFQEKPKKPKSNLASMGVYVFTWKVLRDFLKRDDKDEESEHDFGNNIIPNMLNSKRKIKVYRFSGYWRDVGTLSSLLEANLDLTNKGSGLSFFDEDFSTRIYTEDTHSVPQYIGSTGSIKNSLANQGAIICGKVRHSVISNEVFIEEGAEVTDSFVMPGATIKKNAKVHNAIISPNVVVEEGAEINLGGEEVVLVSK